MRGRLLGVLCRIRVECNVWIACVFIGVSGVGSDRGGSRLIHCGGVTVTTRCGSSRVVHVSRAAPISKVGARGLRVATSRAGRVVIGLLLSHTVHVRHMVVHSIASAHRPPRARAAHLWRAVR